MKKFILSVLACGYLVAGINDGLVAHYEFEGNAKDSSGNGNDGVEYGGVSYVDGVIGKAGSFDGVDSYIKKENPSELNMKKITISSWIYLTKDITYSQARIVCMQTSDSGKESWGVEIFGNNYGNSENNNNLVFHSNNGTNSKNFLSNTNLNIKTWYHMVTINDGVELKIYLNGILINKTDSLGEVYENNAPLVIA